MDILKLDISDPDFLPEAARKILQFAGETRIFLVEGEMGAGKTTLIKHLCEALGSKDGFSSPTYSIVNEYQSLNGKIYHFDLYRIKTEAELLDIGFEEYTSGNNYCFIEWPAIGRHFLDGKLMELQISRDEKNRFLMVKKEFGKTFPHIQ